MSSGGSVMIPLLCDYFNRPLHPKEISSIFVGPSGGIELYSYFILIILN